MKIKILKDEYLFSEQGTHVLDEQGFAVLAQEDCECEVSDEQVERVSALLKAERNFKGLDENGNPIPEQPQPEELPDPSLIIETPAEG